MSRIPDKITNSKERETYLLKKFCTIVIYFLTDVKTYQEPHELCFVSPYLGLVLEDNEF